MTHYLVFIHGVNTRETRITSPHYADQLINLLGKEIGDNRDLKPVPLYWGDVNIPDEKDLLDRYKADLKLWSQLQFKGLREKQILQFVGDAALYISRSTGSLVVDALNKQLNEKIPQNIADTDRLHLITHSMGTVILFDILFSNRWDGYNEAEAIRSRFFGLGPNPQEGLKLCSITTMGSPIGFYSLMMRSAKGLPTTHDITHGLRTMLEALHDRLEIPLPWRNFIHPADIIAYPLTELLRTMVDQNKTFLEVEDILTERGVELDLAAGNENIIANFNLLLSIMNPQLLISLPDIFKRAGELVEKAQLAVAAGPAHGSYWTSEIVAREIVTTIKTVESKLKRIAI